MSRSIPPLLDSPTLKSPSVASTTRLLPPCQNSPGYFMRNRYSIPAPLAVEPPACRLSKAKSGIACLFAPEVEGPRVQLRHTPRWRHDLCSRNCWVSIRRRFQQRQFIWRFHRTWNINQKYQVEAIRSFSVGITFAPASQILQTCAFIPGTRGNFSGHGNGWSFFGCS